MFELLGVPLLLGLCALGVLWILVREDQEDRWRP